MGPFEDKSSAIDLDDLEVFFAGITLFSKKVSNLLILQPTLINYLDVGTFFGVVSLTSEQVLVSLQYVKCS